MIQFDIIAYMGSLTGYTFDRPVLERIALERGVQDAVSLEELSQRDRDLILADMLFVLYTSPTQTASLTKQHGAFSQTIGSQYISDKRNIYELMNKLYAKWDDPKLEDISDTAGGLAWLE